MNYKYLLICVWSIYLWFYCSNVGGKVKGGKVKGLLCPWWTGVRNVEKMRKF